MDKFEKEALKNALLVVIGMVSLIVVLYLCVIHFSAIGEVEKYKQLKEIVERTENSSNMEDILGKVADWNMKIANAKRYNKIPVIEIFVPDKIAGLEYIEIERRKK